MLDAVAWAAPAPPAERPRYFMGLGDAEGILEVVCAGIDMLRLRPADANRPHGLRAHRTRPPQPPQRPVRA